MSRFTLDRLRPPADPEERLSWLCDRQEIADVLAVYCRAQDRCDRALLESVFHEDAVDEHGGVFDGTMRDFCGFALDVLRKCDTTIHLLHQLLIEIDGDDGWSESYVTAIHRYSDRGEPVDSTWHARILDHFQRRDGRWKVFRRKVVYDLNADRTAREYWARGLLQPPTMVGGRFGDDPSTLW